MIINRIIDEDATQIIEDNNGLVELDNCTVLVTGATGMVGSYFIYTLMKLNESYNRNITIIPLVRNVNKLPSQVLNDSHVHPMIQDVTKAIEYDGYVDYIIHTASPSSPNAMKKYPYETNLANTLGTYNTIELALGNRFEDKIQAKSYLYVSSREIYGQPMEGQDLFYEEGPLGQVNPLVPRNGYAEGKKAAENMCVAAREEYGLNAKVVRPFQLYGPMMQIDDGRVQTDFFANVIKGENIVLKSKGEAMKTFTYVSDAVSAMFKVLLYGKENCYNIGSEEDKVSVRELAEILISTKPEDGIELTFDIPESANKGNSAFTQGILCTDRIRQELGWVPKYRLYEGALRTIDWYENFDPKARKLIEESNRATIAEEKTGAKVLKIRPKNSH